MKLYRIVATTPDAVKIITPCLLCQREFPFALDPQGFARWLNGELVQNAFPEMRKEDRELLVSNTCPECWRRTFPETQK